VAGSTTRLTIDIEVDSEPITGRVDIDGQLTRAFVGWTALADLIESARTDAPSGAVPAIAPSSAERSDR
jgi:hypothetical protein